MAVNVRDFSGSSRDIRGSVVDMGGKTQDLQVRETATEIRIDLAADILFDFDKATIKPAAAAALHGAAEIIKGRDASNRAVRIDGYTDSKGTAAYNLRLSERRAESVKEWFSQKESLSNEMVVHGYGATHPVAPNTKPDGSDDPAGRQKNRRVEIVLLK
jgi:outer membrane protein OmpA-like peptidoglycan-associated protein